MDKTMYSSQISDLISAIIVYLCGFVGFFKYAMNVRIEKSEAKTVAKEKTVEDKEGGKE